MTRWVGWLCAWLGVVCLLWSLGVHAGVNDTPHVGPSAGPRGNAVPTSLSLFPSTSLTFIRTRADALESSAPHRACVTAGDGGPPWLDLRGPPGACGRSWVSGKAAGHAGSSKGEAEHVFSRKFPS